MKKLVLSAMAVVLSFGAYAENNNSGSNEVSAHSYNPYYKVISASDLPTSAQAIINQYFGGLSNVNRATVNRYKYEVKTRDGFEIEFNLNGVIQKIESDYKSIPFGVLSNFPGNIYSYVNAKLAGWNLLEVKIKSSKYQLEFEKGRYEAKLVFNGSGTLVKEKYSK